MKTLNEIKKILLEHKRELKEKYKVKTIGIFGSYARGEQTEKSDIDIMIEFYETPDLFKFINLKYYLEDILNVEVDLTTKNALHPVIKENILKEVVYV